MRRKFVAIALLAIILFSLLLNLYNIDFPLGYHIDELKKVRFVKNFEQDFHHPILMLQVVRAGNFLSDFTRSQDIVFLGRISTAIFGALIVFLSYFVSRLTLNKKYSLIVALAVAISPILVVHSHYLKEDIIFTFFALLSLLLFMRFVKRTDNRSLLLLGLATGLALSSKYMGALLILIYLISPLFVQSIKNLNYFKKIFFSVAISLIVFVVVNYPLLYDFGIFWKGIGFETNHALVGHNLKIYAIDNFFAFHLTQSIIPGMTLLLTLLALFFIGFAFFKWKKTGWQDKILIVYTLLFYFSIEFSPSKPFPDFMRYVIPIIPLLIYFSYKGILAIKSFLPKKWKILTVLLILISLAIPLAETIQLDYSLNNDTRAQAKEYLETLPGKAKWGWYALPRQGFGSSDYLNLVKELDDNVSYIVATSFVYKEYAFGAGLSGQDTLVYAANEKYLELFNNYPVKEINPSYKSFGFSNPTVRVVDIREGASN